MILYLLSFYLKHSKGARLKTWQILNKFVKLGKKTAKVIIQNDYSTYCMYYVTVNFQRQNKK